MSKNKIISAIDIGSSKITTLIASVSQNETTFEKQISIAGVSSVESKGIRKAQIVNIEEAVEAAINSIEAAERMAGFNLDSSYISITGASVSSQNSHGVVAVSDPNGEINQSDVDRVIEAASAVSLPSSREIIHIIPREFTVDGESSIKDPIGMSGVRLEVDTHIISASVASIKNIRKAVNEMGVNISGLVFSGVACSNAVATETEKELGCVVIDIGGGTTSIVAYIDGGIAYSGVIPIGARNVTNDLAIGLRISLDDAEKVKVLLSQTKPDKDKGKGDELDLKKEGVEGVSKVSRRTLVEGIIRPRLNEIFSMVKLELEKVHLANKIPSGAIISGGGAETVGVFDSAKRVLQLPVRIGKPFGVTGLIDDIINPAYASSVGLLIYGAKEEDEKVLTNKGVKFKLPSAGFANKIINVIKDLLP